LLSPAPTPRAIQTTHDVYDQESRGWSRLHNSHPPLQSHTYVNRSPVLAEPTAQRLPMPMTRPSIRKEQQLKKVDIVGPLGTRGRHIVKSYAAEVQDVIRLAIALFKCRTLTLHAFPNEKTAHEWAGEVWKQASEEWERWYEITEGIYDLVRTYYILCLYAH
jgi:hypothetical protein